MHALAPPTLFCAALLVATLAPPSKAAEAFAPAGAKATLSVEYSYVSAGSKRSEGMYDPHEWRAKRSVNLVADLAAQAATALPSMQALDAAQSAQMQANVVKSQAIATKMAPMMASAQAIMEKCGEDEACLTREAQKMGAAMQGTPQMAAAMSAKKDAAEIVPGAPRYQVWRPTLQKGSYSIDETAHLSITDPICESRPRQRCTRDEVRKGAGELTLPPGAKKDALAGISAVELDTLKNTLSVVLPVPMSLLAYTETITSDEPAGTHDTPPPKGPRQKQLAFRASASGGGMQDKPITVALKGGWRNQSGEQVVMLKGDFGNAGTLTVRWRFVAL